MQKDMYVCRKVKNSQARTGHRRGMGGRWTEKEGYTTPSTLGAGALLGAPRSLPLRAPHPTSTPRGPSRPRDAAPMARWASSASAVQSCAAGFLSDLGRIIAPFCAVYTAATI